MDGSKFGFVGYSNGIGNGYVNGNKVNGFGSIKSGRSSVSGSSSDEDSVVYKIFSENVFDVSKLVKFRNNKLKKVIFGMEGLKGIFKDDVVFKKL